MARRRTVSNWLGLLLALALTVGIFSNVVYPQNFKATVLVLLGCLVVWTGHRWYIQQVNQLSAQLVNRLIVIAFAVMVLVQLFVLNFLPASVFHDPFRVIYQAEQLSAGHYDWGSSLYFWRFPNNVPLTVLLAGWLKLASLVHIGTTTAIHVISLILLDSLIAMSLWTVRYLTKHQAAVVTLAGFFLVSPFAYTYYLQVFYSDVPTLLCLSIAFNILLRWPHYSTRQRWLFGIALLVDIVLGGVIKPNLIVMAVAVVLAVIVLAIRSRKILKRYWVPFAVIMLAFALMIPTSAGLKRAGHFTARPTEQFPTMHWIWMGYNPNYSGKYNFSDVQKLSQLPNIQQRQTYLKHALPARLKQLGVWGVVKRWGLKAAILLNVARLQSAYTGGLVSSPAWYQHIEAPLSIIGSTIMRIGFIMLDLLAIIKCLRYWRQPKRHDDPIMTLAILTALGYIAFHTLLWESEPRYGQAIAPLLLLISTMRLPDVTPIREAWSLRRRMIVTGVLGLGLAGMYVTESVPLPRPNKVMVASQMSQLSLQFDAKRTPIAAHETVSQRVRLNVAARKMAVSVAPHAQFDGILVNEKTHQRYHLLRTQRALVYPHPIPVGHYQIRVTNQLNRTQGLLLSKTIAYRLAPEPLVYQHRSRPFESFVYEFSR